MIFGGANTSRRKDVHRAVAVLLRERNFGCSEVAYHDDAVWRRRGWCGPGKPC